MTFASKIENVTDLHLWINEFDEKFVKRKSFEVNFTQNVKCTMYFLYLNAKCSCEFYKYKKKWCKLQISIKEYIQGVILSYFQSCEKFLSLVYWALLKYCFKYITLINEFRNFMSRPNNKSKNVWQWYIYKIIIWGIKIKNRNCRS